jgi:hypothetical protein
MTREVVEEITLAEFAKRFLNLTNFKDPIVIDLSDKNVEILSHDGEKECFRQLTHFVVKKSVDKHYQIGELKGTSQHKVLRNNVWTKLSEHSEAILVDTPIEVVDVSVAETECYIANGQVNHNTTPGGMAVPFHSSVRLSLIGGSKIENKDGDIIGINVAAKTVKNKVAPPLRKVEFQIHFGRGIFEHEEIYDVLRMYCEKNGPIEKDGKKLLVDGGGAWKSLTVTDSSGNVIVTKKFTKKDFDKVVSDPVLGKYVDDMMEAAYVKLPSKSEQDEVLNDSGEEGDDTE